MVFFDHRFKSFDKTSVDFTNLSYMQIVLRGDLVALLGSVAATLHLVWCEKLTEDYPKWLSFNLLYFFSTFFQLIFSLLIEHSTINANPTTGIFGVFTTQQILINIIMSLVTGIFCSAFFIILKFIFIELHYNIA